MKSIFTAIWNFFAAVRTAKTAANLSRNGKWQEAQAMYRD